MDDLTRRGMIRGAASAGLLGMLAQGSETDAKAADEPRQHDDGQSKPDRKNQAGIDRECVIASGMTDDEADCWELAAKLAGKFFELPELHPMDKQDIADAIHVVQHRLLSRPTYRKYREEHKKRGEKTPKKDESKAK